MTAGALKYQAEIAAGNCGTCPPPHCIPPSQTISAVRFAYSAIPSSKDFLPSAIEQPARQLGGSHGRKCSGFALSFFISKERARDCLVYIAANSKNFVSKWSYCHLTTINPTDGLVSPIDSKGHFDLHEFSHVSMEVQSIFLEAL